DYCPAEPSADAEKPSEEPGQSPDLHPAAASVQSPTHSNAADAGAEHHIRCQQDSTSFLDDLWGAAEDHVQCGPFCCGAEPLADLAWGVSGLSEDPGWCRR